MIEPDRSVRAEFDYDNARIRLPLAAFMLSGEDWHVIDTANFLLYDGCLRRRGYRYFPIGHYVHTEDRRYGLWHVGRARMHGFALAGETAHHADEGPDVDDPGWQDAFAACSDEVAAVRATLVPDGEPVADGVASTAYRHAHTDPAWERARRAWWACLEAHGLEPDRREGKWGCREPGAFYARYGPERGDPAIRAELVRIAVIEAQCNSDCGMARTLADLEAGYQAVLIRENEAALAAEKAASQVYLAAARAYIATHR